MSLPSELGPEYIREHLVGALFRRNNEIVYLSGCDSAMLRLRVFDLTNKDNMEWQSVSRPHDFLNSFSDLAWPKLGYRNFEADQVYGNVVSYLTTPRSVHRGLREENISYESPFIYQALWWPVLNYHPASNTLYRVSQIFDPTWISFREGMDRIKSLEIPGFAMNEDLAVAVSVDQGADKFCDLLFRGRVVGEINHNNELTLSNVVLKRSSLKRLKKLMES